MSMMVSFVLSFFPRDVLDEILNLIESVSEDFPSYSYMNGIKSALQKYLELINSIKVNGYTLEGNNSAIHTSQTPI